MMSRSTSTVVMFTALVACCAVPALAGDHPIEQTKKVFSVPVLKAKVGDTVTFRNNDEFAHNVYSLSETQNFDLGTIEVECAIHPEMKMKIEVSK
jgi:plastocyanin